MLLLIIIIVTPRLELLLVGGIYLMKKFFVSSLVVCVVALSLVFAGAAFPIEEETVRIVDAWGRRVDVPSKVERVICSGPGCLRYLVYLNAQDFAVGVDSIEKRKSRFDSRPYAIAHPELKDKPLFGEFRGFDNPELILSLDPAPQVIFKTYANMGYDPDELQAKTGIPVVVLNYGHLVAKRKDMERSLMLMGKILGKEERAEEVIDFFNGLIEDLGMRTEDMPDDKRPSCYVGGIAYKGPHGLTSTEPNYPPFYFTDAVNVAFCGSSQNQRQVVFSRENLLSADPDKIFIDLSTTQGDRSKNALYQLANDPEYKILSAVKKNEVYGLLPYNWYTQNHGSILANAYYVGKILYPERFKDIDPMKKADEIYTFLVGKAVFENMDESFGNLAFRRINLNEIEW